MTPVIWITALVRFTPSSLVSKVTPLLVPVVMAMDEKAVSSPFAERSRAKSMANVFVSPARMPMVLSPTNPVEPCTKVQVRAAGTGTRLGAMEMLPAVKLATLV